MKAELLLILLVVTIVTPSAYGQEAKNFGYKLRHPNEEILEKYRLRLLFPSKLVYDRRPITEKSIIGNNFRWISGDEGNRTPDLGVANAALSHLSYIPTNRKPSIANQQLAVN